MYTYYIDLVTVKQGVVNTAAMFVIEMFVFLFCRI